MRLFAIALLLTASSLHADTFAIDLNTEFSGATEPSGSGPWARATFTDVMGGVQLTMEALLNGATEKIAIWSFNLYQTLEPTSLSFASKGGQAADTIDTQKGKDTKNCCKADGDGYFDIQFNFATSGAGAFTAGETSTYLISGIPGLLAEDFKFQSEIIGGGNSVWYSAAHVQGIGTGASLSGWIGGDTPYDPNETPIPEPLSIILLGTVLVGVTYVSRKRRAA